MGKYSFKNIKRKYDRGSRKVNCFFCGTEVEVKIIKAHSRKTATCGKCKKVCEVCEAVVQEVSTESATMQIRQCTISMNSAYRNLKQSKWKIVTMMISMYS